MTVTVSVTGSRSLVVVVFLPWSGGQTEIISTVVRVNAGSMSRVVKWKLEAGIVWLQERRENTIQAA